ncbi:MAG: D-alanyl-D-alanine carboxypeptidase, partial [Pseudomonadota bacterium]
NFRKVPENRSMNPPDQPAMKVALCLILSSFLAACSAPEPTLFKGIPAEGDGVVSVDVGDITEETEQVIEEIIEEDQQLEEEEPEDEIFRSKDELSRRELELVNELHNGERDKLSFFIVDVERSLVMRSYLAEVPRRLASVSKIPTALAALEEVNNVSITKVTTMLKNSHNGEASRYVRLAGRAIGGHVTTGESYSQGASCPSAFRNDRTATKIAQNWLFGKMPSTDWADASLNDGAGCDYDNFMNSIQVTSILEWADSRGQAYAGQSFERLLSIAGVDGTWRNRNRESSGRIFAKTGTLRPNSNLVGYFYARRDGTLKKYYFTVFVEKRGAGSHTTRARQLIESLVRYWIAYYSQTVGDPVGRF